MTTRWTSTTHLRLLPYVPAACAILLVVTSGGWMSWAARRPDIRLWLTLDATDVQVVMIKPGAWTITYPTAGRGAAWRQILSTRLERRAWGRPAWWRPDSGRAVYVRVASGRWGSMWEQVELLGDSETAQIHLQRWIEIPWLRWLRLRVTMAGPS